MNKEFRFISGNRHITRSRLVLLQALSIVIKNGIDFDLSYKLPVYNISTFKNEISEFIDYFYPYYLNKNISLPNKMSKCEYQQYVRN